MLVIVERPFTSDGPINFANAQWFHFSGSLDGADKRRYIFFFVRHEQTTLPLNENVRKDALVLKNGSRSSLSATVASL